MTEKSASAPTHLHLFLTGFGPFGTVIVNPSSTIAQHICERLQKLAPKPFGTNEHVSLRPEDVHYTELETSIDACDAYFRELQNTVTALLAAAAANGTHAKIILCHIGVVSCQRSGDFRVETRAYNELDARWPDQKGRVFNHEPIDDKIPVPGSPRQYFLESLLVSTVAWRQRLSQLLLALNAKHDALKKQFGWGNHFYAPTWRESIDAGRYLCNYCLYQSLKIQNQLDGVTSTLSSAPSGDQESVLSLFIHVPDPEFEKNASDTMENPPLEVEVEKVYQFVEELLTLVGSSS